MKTKLDDLVGYLAGREGSSKLKEELADPLSEASLFLEATRSRSRALVREPQAEPAQKISRTRLWLVAASVFLLMVLATAVLSSLVETRIRRLEESQRRGEVEARSMAEKLQVSLNRLIQSRPIETGFERIQSGFEGIDKRLDRLEQAQDQPKVDPAFVELRDSLASLRKEISALEKGSLRQAEDFRTTTLEIARLLRLLVTRSQPAGPEPVPDLPNPRRP